MKQIRWVGFLVIVLAVAGAIYMAMSTGEKSPIFAAGKVALNSELADKAQGIRTLYIVVYDADSQMPMPFGAMKERLNADAHNGEFFDFMITREKLQVMGGADVPAPKHMRLKVRLDKDGLAGMDQPGDLIGSVENVAFGSDRVNVTIDKMVQ